MACRKKSSGADTFYNTGITATFCIEHFLKDGAPFPQIVGTSDLLHDFLCIPRPWECSSGSNFCCVPNQFLGRVQRSSSKDSAENTMAHSTVACVGIDRSVKDLLPDKLSQAMGANTVYAK